jgi:hypothetical protein
VVVSTATFAGESAELQGRIHGDHFGQNLEHLLGDGLVIYGDQILGLRIDLECLVEGQRGINFVCA